MNLINRPKPELTFLQWRKDNVEFLLSEYIPFLLKKLNSKYSQILDYKFELPDETTQLDGYAPDNVKILKITLETLRGKFDLSLRLPVPGNQDLFYINRKVYVLVNQLEEHAYYFYLGDIRTQKFVIYANEGVWQAHAGSSPRKNIKARPIYLLMMVYDILDRYLPGFDIVKSIPSDNSKTKHEFKLQNGKYLVFNKDVDITNPLVKLILKSFLNDPNPAREISPTAKQDHINIIEKQNPIDYYFEFSTGITTLRDLFIDIFDRYRDPKYHKYHEIHGSFSKVSYYHQVLRQLEVRIANIRNIFERARNLTSDISWHQKIPDTFLKHLMIHRGLQYLEPNPFKEISQKYKLTYFLNNVPTYLREPRFSLIRGLDFVASPDNKNIGVVQHFVYDVQLDKYGYFKEVI